MYQDYSVLMSVYAKEKPEYLKQAIQSMMDQTVPTNDFVLVCDGPLTPELDNVIIEYQNSYPDIFHIIRLSQNQGLGKALNVGLQHCKNELVARMDSDDISVPNRCQIQLDMFTKNISLSLASGAIAEFDKSPDQLISVRNLPCMPEEISKFAKRRNPMNHMAVMYRKKEVMNAGNYQEMPLAEDYYLWARMLCHNCQAQNTEKILVYARVGNGMYQRRGGLLYAKRIYSLQKSFLKLRFISKFEFIQNCLIRISASLLPACIRKQIYQKSLRGHI